MILELNELTMRFGGITALDHISVQVEEKTIHGVIGPNGSGKTTLFNVINGIYTPTSGTVTFMGEDITGLKPHQIAKKGIGRTFQLLRIFPSMTLIENLMIALTTKEKSTAVSCMFSTPRMHKEQRWMEGKAMEILRIIGLEKKAYNSAGGISIGQRRMLQLGQGIISAPKLLLLDECAAGLDPVNIDKLIELILYIRSELGITIMMVEHIMNVVMRVSDVLTVLDYGERIFVGDPKEAVENPHVIEAYLGADA